MQAVYGKMQYGNLTGNFQGPRLIVEVSAKEARDPVSGLSRLGLPVVVAIIAAAAFATMIPMFWLGIPSGHDFEFHVNSWMEVAGQWQQGILYPRWAAMANYGYGEPRFIFYPPASWMLGAALGMALPWWIVPGVYIWAVLTAAGCSMFALARNWLPRKHAVFAAVLYAVNPYHLVIVYWRGAFAELMASIWLPLLLLFVLRLGTKNQNDRKAMGYLSLVIAAVWLTNLPSAVMVNYSVVLLVGVVALVRRSPRVLLYGAGACALGIALAAFYVLPAAYEQRWVQIKEVLDLGVRPQSNFLFAVIADPDHNRFNLLVSVVATLEILALSVAMLISRRRTEHREIWCALTAWGGAAALFMLPFTVILWNYLPQLRFIQLPWRWLLCLGVAFALLVAMSTRRWLSRGLLYATMLIALAAGWRWIQPPWWDTRADIAEMNDNIQEGQGYESVREYIPTAGDLETIQHDAPEVTVEGDSGQLQVDEWAPETKLFSVAVTQPSRLVLHLFNYPAWKVEVNGHSVTTETQNETGQMIIPVQRGESHVSVIFSRTWDRKTGELISGLALLIIALLLLLGRKLMSNGRTASAVI
jgi:hypothetical protein